MVTRKVLSSSRPQHDRLRSMIAANPGIHIRRLSQLVGLSWNTCLHHLRTMESEGAVVSRKVQGKVCYFDRSQGAVHGKQAVCLLRDPDNRRLAARILEAPGQKQVEIAHALEMATSSVHRRVSRLEEAGLLERMARSRSVHVFPSEQLLPLAQEAGVVPGGPDDLFDGPADAVADPLEADAPWSAPVEDTPDAPLAPLAADPAGLA